MILVSPFLNVSAAKMLIPSADQICPLEKTAAKRNDGMTKSLRHVSYLHGRVTDLWGIPGNLGRVSSVPGRRGRGSPSG